VLARVAAQVLKSSRVLVVDDRTAYGTGLANEFAEAYRRLGFQTIERESVTDKTTDFSKVVTTAKAFNPDLVFYGGMDTTAGPMAAQLHAAGLKFVLLGGDGICSSKLPQLAGSQVPEVSLLCSEAGGVEGHERQRFADFHAKFKTRFQADVQVYAPYTYDAVHVLVSAMQRAGSTDPKVYLAELAATKDHAGVTGLISFDAKGDLVRPAMSIFGFRDGKRRQLSVIR
jgi:branched-chain amino acid transport system substrate-binding protein